MQLHLKISKADFADTAFKHGNYVICLKILSCREQRAVAENNKINEEPPPQEIGIVNYGGYFHAFSLTKLSGHQTYGHDHFSRGNLILFLYNTYSGAVTLS
ncbi:hypothetical protein [Undibacterium terreum]|uniref:hypothetical protein n=1 Tax=Undibacterium terreum TaxID=1224302 RepID=UPI0016633C86|nr:hypothetical protein [Undibacterium terreum]